MRYRAEFTGRKVNAIGRVYPITTKVEADDPEAARVKLYDEYEHISGLKLTTTFPPSLSRRIVMENRNDEK